METPETLLARIDERTEQILSEAKKTNGRVSNLESRVGVIETWKAFMSGQKSVILWGMGLLGGGLGFLIKHFFFT